MDIQPEFAKKDIVFINNKELRDILFERLNELDKAFLVNCNYSVIFMSISIVEGILKHIGEIYKTEIQKLKDYPKNPRGQGKKEFDNLTINELYKFLGKIDVLSIMPDFEQFYDQFRDYRNFIHPQAQVRKSWPIDTGHAQIALGLLNVVIAQLSHYIFIGKLRFKRCAGYPDYGSNKTLHLKVHQIPLHSFLVSEQPLNEKLFLEFDLHLPHKSVFNLVFNFKDSGDFKMLRLDNREDPNYANCMLICSQEFFWREKLFAEPSKPPQKPISHLKIIIDIPKKIFSVNVDGVEYKYNDKEKKAKRLFEEISPGLQVGFFNEVGPVKLSNIEFKIT